MGEICCKEKGRLRIHFRAVAVLGQGCAGHEKEHRLVAYPYSRKPCRVMVPSQFTLDTAILETEQGVLTTAQCSFRETVGSVQELGTCRTSARERGRAAVTHKDHQWLRRFVNKDLRGRATRSRESGLESIINFKKKKLKKMLQLPKSSPYSNCSAAFGMDGTGPGLLRGLDKKGRRRVLGT